MLKHLIIDAGSISYWKLFSLVSKNKGFDDKSAKLFMMQESDDGFPNWQLVVEHEIIKLIEKFNPHKCTIACDGADLWRKHFYPEYKANRKKARMEWPIDWDIFYKVRDDLFFKMADLYPIKTIYDNRAEADDIIAVLVKEYHEHEQLIAVTGDADIHQLFRFDNFRCYDGKKGEEVKGVDALDLLNMKLVMGDRGDNIKALRPRIGPASARKILNECKNDIHSYCVENGLSSELQLNQKLINFEFIPKKLYTRLIDQYENAKISVRDNSFLVMNSCLDYLDLVKFSSLNLFNYNTKTELNKTT